MENQHSKTRKPGGSFSGDAGGGPLIDRGKPPGFFVNPSEDRKRESVPSQQPLCSQRTHERISIVDTMAIVNVFVLSTEKN